MFCCALCSAAATDAIAATDGPGDAARPAQSEDLVEDGLHAPERAKAPAPPASGQALAPSSHAERPTGEQTGSPMRLMGKKGRALAGQGDGRDAFNAGDPLDL